MTRVSTQRSQIKYELFLTIFVGVLKFGKQFFFSREYELKSPVFTAVRQKNDVLLSKCSRVFFELALLILLSDRRIRGNARFVAVCTFFYASPYGHRHIVHRRVNVRTIEQCTKIRRDKDWGRRIDVRLSWYNNRRSESFSAAARNRFRKRISEFSSRRHLRGSPPIPVFSPRTRLDVRRVALPPANAQHVIVSSRGRVRSAVPDRKTRFDYFRRGRFVRRPRRKGDRMRWFFGNAVDTLQKQLEIADSSSGMNTYSAVRWEGKFYRFCHECYMITPNGTTFECGKFVVWKSRFRIICSDDWLQIISITYFVAWSITFCPLSKWPPDFNQQLESAV